MEQPDRQDLSKLSLNEEIKRIFLKEYNIKLPASDFFDKKSSSTTGGGGFISQTNNFLFIENTYTGTSNSNIQANSASKELKQILDGNLIFENEDDKELFRESIQAYLTKHSNFGIQQIAKFSRLRLIDEKKLSIILERMGKIKDENTYSERLLLLHLYLSDTSPIIRFGAIEGISNMEAKKSLKPLIFAKNKEKYPFLTGLLSSVITRLKNLYN